MVVTLAGCSGTDNTDGKQSPKPRHETNMPTTPDQLRAVVDGMKQHTVPSLDSIFTPELLSLSREARLLVAGIPEGTLYREFDWSAKMADARTLATTRCTHTIDSIAIDGGNARVSMRLASGTAAGKRFTLVMKQLDGQWLIDDILYPDAAAPDDSERHSTQDYIDRAANHLMNGDVEYIVNNNVTSLMPDYKTKGSYYAAHPEAIDQAIATIETAKHYLKENRRYTPAHEKKLDDLIKQIESTRP